MAGLPCAAGSELIVQRSVESVRAATRKTALGGNPRGAKGTSRTHVELSSITAQGISAVGLRPVSTRGAAVGVGVAVCAAGVGVPVGTLVGVGEVSTRLVGVVV